VTIDLIVLAVLCACPTVPAGEADTPEPSHTLKGHTAPVLAERRAAALALSADGSTLAVAVGNEVRVRPVRVLAVQGALKK
jgi:hypothetical protein